MIEWAMLFTLGFVAASIIALIAMNSVRKRTERLTIQRVQATTPLSMTEIRADKDQMRAEFAMATRRLELNLDNLRERASGQLQEIADKNEQIKNLTHQLDGENDNHTELTAEKETIEDELSELRHELREMREESVSLAASYQKLVEDNNHVSSENSALSSENESFRTENAILKQKHKDELSEKNKIQTQLTEIKDGLNEAAAKHEKQLYQLERKDSLIEKAESVSNLLRSQIADLEEQISNKINGNNTQNISEKKALAAEKAMREVAVNLSTIEQDKTILEHENTRLKKEILDLKKELQEKSQQLSSLDHMRSEDWEEDRLSSSLLRERINDMAAEITAMTAVLDDEDGKIRTQFSQICDTQSELNIENGADESQSGLSIRMRSLQKLVDEQKV